MEYYCWLSQLRERSLAVLALIIAFGNDWKEGKIEWSKSYFLGLLLPKILVLLDIFRFSAFHRLKKSFEEKIEALALRVNDENEVLNERIDAGSPNFQTVRKKKKKYRENINLLTN